MELFYVNISGASFILNAANVKRLPNTFLGEFYHMNHRERMRHCHSFLAETGEYVFQRSPEAFMAIAEFYRIGALHIPFGYCLSPFMDELEFWKIGTANLGKCCETKIPRYFEKFAKLPTDPFKGLQPSAFRRWVYRTTETVDTTAGKVFCVLSGLLLIAAILLLLVNSDPLLASSLQVCIDDRLDLVLGSLEIVQMPVGDQLSDPAEIFLLNENGSLHMYKYERELVAEGIKIAGGGRYHYPRSVNRTSHMSEIAELARIGYQRFLIIRTFNDALVSYFSLELLLRFWATPNRRRFFTVWANIFDLVANCSFYIERILFKTLQIHVFHSGFGFEIIRALRLVRLLRTLRFARYSVGLQAVGSTLMRCYKTFISLGLFVSVLIIVCAYLIVIMESEDNGNFYYSIPQGMYWAIITLTTVGFGDLYPQTTGGKILTCVIAISGMIFMAFPVSMIVNNFVDVFQELSQKREFEEHQRKLVQEQHSAKKEANEDSEDEDEQPTS